MEKLFAQLSRHIMSRLKSDEHLALNCNGESSFFSRFSQARIRQSGIVEEVRLGFNLIHKQRRITSSINLTNNLEQDIINSLAELTRLRQEIVQLPEDPYLILPQNTKKSRAIHEGRLLNAQESTNALLAPIQGVDLAGIWASGHIYKGSSNSSGGSHWFATDTYSFDYSLITPDEKMVKATFAGSHWDQEKYQAFLSDSIIKMELMNKPLKRIKPGSYRTFIASAGVADLLAMFSWHGLSESAIQQGESAFGKMRNEGATLSPLFSFSEDFTNGLVPRFNDYGEIAPERIQLIEKGRLKNSLVSSRTAKEYNLISNFAEDSEQLRSPLMSTGSLKEADILKTLDTGIYLSNLHYLNWSDMIAGRITGMTRYACFWVEDGKIKAPIETMRFEDSFYHFFGNNLEAVTETAQINPEVGTYNGREINATTCPGILLKSFALTL